MDKRTRLIVPKSVNDLVVSNLLQLREIEKYHKLHPDRSINQAAVEWIDRNSARWRGQHPLTLGVSHV